jgi:hypothetical protein
MFEARRHEKAVEAVRSKYPDYPFDNLDDPDIRREARRYLREVPRMHPEGLSEIVIVSHKLPDRRLGFPDQHLQMRLRHLSREAMAERMNVIQNLGSQALQ